MDSVTAFVAIASVLASVLTSVLGGIVLWLWKIDDRIFLIQGHIASQRFREDVSCPCPSSGAEGDADKL